MPEKICKNCLYHAMYLGPYNNLIHRCKAHNEAVTDLQNFCELWTEWTYDSPIYLKGGKGF